MYKQTGEYVQRLSDKAIIPADPRNLAYQEYQEWRAKGNKPEPEFTLTQLKDFKRRTITDNRNAALANLVVQWDGDNWDGDEPTAARIANALTMVREAAAIGLETPPAIPWRTADNRDRVLTLDQLRALGAAIFLAQQQVWLKQAQLKNQVEAAASEEALLEIQW